MVGLLLYLKKNGNFYSMDNSCKHAGGPLSQGKLDGEIVTCPLHKWKFNIKTGLCENVKNIKQETFDVKVEGNYVFVKIIP